LPLFISLKVRPSRQYLIHDYSVKSSSSRPSKLVTSVSDIQSTCVYRHAALGNFLLRMLRHILRVISVYPNAMRKHWTKSEHRQENILVYTDETRDASWRQIANVTTRALKSDRKVSEKSILPSCQEVYAVNHITIARVFNASAAELRNLLMGC
jgi:hypothetical protein